MKYPYSLSNWPALDIRQRLEIYYNSDQKKVAERQEKGAEMIKF